MWQGLKVKRFNVVFEVKQFVHSKKQRRHSVYCNCYFIPPFKLLNSPVLRKRWISWNQSGWLSWLSSSSSLLLLLLLLLWLLYEWNSVIQFYKYSIRSNGATVVSRCRVLFLLTLLAKMRMRCCRAPDMFLLSRMCVCVCCIWQNVCLGWVQLYELLNFIKYVEYKTLSLNFHVFCTMTMWVPLLPLPLALLPPSPGFLLWSSGSPWWCDGCYTLADFTSKYAYESWPQNN